MNDKILDIVLEIIDKRYSCIAIRKGSMSHLTLSDVTFEIINNFKTYKFGASVDDSIIIKLFPRNKMLTYSITAEIMLESPTMSEEILEAVEALMITDGKIDMPVVAPFNK